MNCQIGILFIVFFQFGLFYFIEYWKTAGYTLNKKAQLLLERQ